MHRTIISSQMEIHKHVNSFCQNSTNVRNICPIFAVVLKQGKFKRVILFHYRENNVDGPNKHKYFIGLLRKPKHVSYGIKKKVL